MVQQKENQSKLNTNAILFQNKNVTQLYTGLYLEKCYHNVGIYKWTTGDYEYVYEGKLYANDLHGYGRLKYPNHSDYEGLFFHNKRFGPGILTYQKEGAQDVGLWNGKYLVRLAQQVSLADYYLEFIPSIAKTIEGKLYLLQFKTIVPLIDENDPFENLVNKFNISNDDRKKLYSQCVRNRKSLFMNRPLFDKNFYTNPKDLIVDVVKNLDENNKPVVSKITASNLMAWNNGNLSISIMKHAFSNRKFENIMNYKIRNVLLEDKRRLFMTEGPIEQLSLDLLLACRNDDTLEIIKIICDHNIYPDLADCYGNNTIVYAALTNSRDAVKVLVDLGANVNNLNDECISALMFCILNYIAIKRTILCDDWELAFFKPIPNPNEAITGKVWPTHSGSSSSDISSSSSKSTDINSKKQRKYQKNKKRRNRISEGQCYVFNLICKQPAQSVDTLSLKSRKSVKKIKTYNVKDTEANRMKIDALDNIEKTVYALLECGADPNICQVPFAPLIIALFGQSETLLECLLEHNADANIRTSTESGHLTPLHIACGMETTGTELNECINILLNYGADVNARCNSNHWEKERDNLLAGVLIEDDLGKTPFQILAMRHDFMHDPNHVLTGIANSLLENGADLNAEYLGHNALTLAMIRGNKSMINFVLNTDLIDPNDGLGNNMGTPLAMLALNRYKSILPSDIECIYQMLIDKYGNPFNAVPDFDGNVIDFAVADNEMNNFYRQENQSFRILKKLSFLLLRRYVDSRAIQILYKDKIELENNSPRFAHIVKYVNVEKAYNILQILLDNDVLELTPELCLKLIDYIKQATTKSRKPKTAKEDISNILENSIMSSNLLDTNTSKNNIDTKLNKSKPSKKNVRLADSPEKNPTLNFSKQNREEMENPFKNNMPEIDQDHEKYKVCYGCLQRKKKKLQLCSYCYLVYFCSQNCNEMRNLSMDHPCNKMSYKKTKEKYTSVQIDNSINSSDFKFEEQDEFEEGDTSKRRRDKSKRRRDKSKRRSRSRSDTSRSDTSRSRSGTRRSRSGTRRRRSHTRRSKGKREKGSKRRRNIKNEKETSRKKIKYAITSKNRIFLKKKICTSPCAGKLVSINFKESLKEVEKQIKYRYKLSESNYELLRDKSKELSPFYKVNLKQMLQVARRIKLQLVPVKDENTIVNPCDPFDYKFWQLFVPYCVYQNGELFYRSNDDDLLYRFPYKQD